MEKNVYLVRWYGPFTKEEFEEWSENETVPFNLYLLHGKRPYAKTRECFYCGMTMRTALTRFKDKGHHIEEIENRCTIYVGRIVNKKTKRTDVQLIEKLITSYLDLDINYSNGNGELLNRTNFNPPKEDAYIINEWVRPADNEVWQRIKVNSPAHIVPDLMIYKADSHTVQGVKRIKQLGRL